MFFKSKRSDLQSWIEGCKRNDRRCQKDLYYFYFDLICKVIRRYTKDEHLTLEILNDAMLKVYKNIDKYEEKGSFEAWLKRIVYTTVVDHFRSSQKKIKFILPEELLDFQDKAIEEEPGLTLEEIMIYIKSLPEMAAQVFILFVLEGYSHREIAQILDIAENTSKWYLMNAKKELRNCINQNYANQIG